MSITNKQIESLLPGQIIWDDSLKGFGVIKRTDKTKYHTYHTYQIT